VKREEKLLVLLAALGGLGAWLWFTQSGRAIASSAGGAIATGASETSEAVSTGVRYVESLIRGERNIRISSASWQGKLSPNTDGAFEQFDTPENGIRALAIVLKNYQVMHSIGTVRGIVTRWAPSNENDTGAYIASVAGSMGVGPDDPLSLTDPATLFSLTRAIIKHENGRVAYDDSTINAGVARAYG
jgi:hypothetical protein